MIVKLDDVQGDNLANLLRYLHNEKNVVHADDHDGREIRLAQLKSVTPQPFSPSDSRISYDLSIEIVDGYKPYSKNRTVDEDPAPYKYKQTCVTVFTEIMSLIRPIEPDSKS